jgi:hypothetical protein
VRPRAGRRHRLQLRLQAWLPTRGLHRLRLWIALSVVVGAVTGVGVVALHLVVQELAWGPLSRRSSWWVVVLPLSGTNSATFPATSLSILGGTEKNERNGTRLKYERGMFGGRSPARVA